MKATLGFNLPEDKHDYQLANQAPAMLAVLWGFAQWLRAEIKYHDKVDYEAVQDQFHELLELYNINIYEE